MLTGEITTYALLMLAADFINSNKHEAADLLCDEVLKRNEAEEVSKYSTAVALTCKGQICADNHDHEQAIEYYKEALKRGSDDDAIIKYYLALSLLSIGRWGEGFCFLYMARTECTTLKALCVAHERFDKQTLFQMQPPPATVYIHTDAGYGDNILTMRYLPLLAKKGYKVIYGAKPEMVKLARDSCPGIKVIEFTETQQFDYQLPIMDLPYLFKTNLHNIPWDGPYIKADPALVAEYKRFKGMIGICWHRPGVGYVENKSVPFEYLTPITTNSPFRFVSLQPNKDGPIFEHSTLAETAALIFNLDLVISIDSAVAHLAGAMGKPTWLMMHKYTTSFQFMAETPNASWNRASPWYPSMRIFRQETKGDWKPVIDAITAELGR